MPNIADYETEEDWMGACVPARVEEGDEQEQAVAVCMTMWRDKDKDKGKKRSAPLEYKSFVQQVKQVDGRTVTGFAGIYGNVDSGSDRTWAGSFKKTISERADRVRHLWQHDLSQPPIAAIRELREVGKADLPPELLSKYPEATGGLLVVREYLETPRGDEVLKGIISGAISEMSFGYDPIKWDYENDKATGTQIRNLRECRLWDTSDVNWGMNEATIAAKHNPAILFAELLADLKAAQGFDLAALKAGRVLSSANLERLKAALETLTSILSAAEPAQEEETPKAQPLTERELATLKARFVEVQRLAKLYQQ
jgi:HK97 family phage prohead protease